MEERFVLAGFDGSPASEQALRWAAAEASLRRTPLQVCHAWDWPYPLRSQDVTASEIVREMGVMVLQDGVRIAQQAAPGLQVRPLLRKGTAPGVLIGAAAGAALVVIGTRGAGGFDTLLVGSAALQVPAHADSPVVVVPPRDTGGGARRIVVGVDGAPASQAALRFALREARLRDATVTIICGWWDPAALPGPERLPFTDAEALKERAKARFEGTVAPCLAGYRDVAVERRFVLERPQRALADNAKDADLLVVGDRGIGSSPTTLLGAVTRSVLHHAPSPVAIVHEHDADLKEPS